MAFNEELVERLREKLKDIPNVEEKRMFGGMTFMINDKMCIGVSHDNLMCRIDPAFQDEAIKTKGASIMEMKGRVYNGYIFVKRNGYESDSDLQYWLKLCLDFNKFAKSSKKKK